MSEVKVFRWESDDEMYESKSGVWVHVDDYDRLAARVRELEAMYESSHASRMHAESVVRRLEAENEALKAAVWWAIQEQTREAHYFGDEKALQTEQWGRAHPIIRSVIEGHGT